LNNGDAAPNAAASDLDEILPAGLTGALLSGADDGGGDNAIPAVATLDLAGDGTTLQPVFDAANSAIKEVHFEMELLSHETGTSDIVHAVTGLGETVGLGEIGAAPAPDGPTNLVTDVLNLPGDLLSGNLDGIISNLSSDLTDIVNAVATLKDSVIFGGDPVNPVPELINGLGGDLSSLPLLSVDNGNGGLLDGVVGDLSHSSSGHLADANIGPEQDDGLQINLLAAPEPGPSHTVDANVIDVGPSGPNLAALGVLTGGDSLVGNLLDLGGVTGSVHSDAGGLPALPALGGDLPDIAGIVGADHGILDLHGLHLV
jgi:hypothetical protein